MMRRLFAQLVILAVAAMAIAGLSGVSQLLTRHQATDVAADTTTIASVRAELTDTREQLDRAHQIIEYSGRYAIPADLSAQIYDIAVSEGIPAPVGFQLVKVESGFQNSALSGASAIGLTQLRLTTARGYDATVDPSDLMNANVNLRIGFRYLKDLLNRFDHNLPLALEAYNKGPTFVSAEQALGVNVEGRYSHAVMSGLHTRS